MLRYLWIKDYKNIQEQGFQFDPALEASYDPVTGRLTLEKHPEKALAEEFFGPNVQLVTGILGENGAGKSALMEFLRSVAGSFANGLSYSTPPCLFVFGETIVHQSSVNLTNKDSLVAQGYRLYDYDDTISYNHLYINNLNEGTIDTITQHVYIYYSNFWESSAIEQAPAGIDVSTTHSIEDIHTRVHFFRNDKQDSLTAFWTQSFFWEIQALNFLSTKSFGSMPFPLPRFLSLRAKEPNEVYQAQGLDDKFFEAVQAENLKRWVREFERRADWDDPESPIEEFIARFILPRLLVLIRVFPQDFAGLSDGELSGLSLLTSSPPRVRDEDLTIQLRNLYEFVTFLREATEAGHVSIFEEDGLGRRRIRRAIQLRTDAVSQEKLVTLFSRLLHTPNDAQTFDARWSGLSSGQAAYLRLHARLYQALVGVAEREETHHHPVSSVTILVDEGETGFHPQWQKQYVQLLLDIMRKMFAEYKVQLIIGSNSPFIASDIPQSNLLLLHRRAGDGHCEVKSYAGREQTFAANIHTLLTDSFFLQGGLMGDFARTKVNMLIQYLQPAAPTQDDRKEEMRAIMEMIGEPVIRMKLREMWNAKFGAEEEIAELQRRIIQLRRQQGNGQDRA